MTLASPIAVWIVALLGVVICMRIKADRVARLLAALGALLIAFAAGDPTLHWTRPADVLVMIDESASTRGAEFHDEAKRAARLRQLVRNANIRTLTFSSATANSTVWSPPQADAILLFSDGQFELPDNVSPTWPIIDSNLVSPADASVESITAANDGGAVVRVRNTGAPRQLSGDGTTHSIPPGGSVLATQPAAEAIDFRLNPGDAWPENDSLAVPPADARESKQLWIGDHPPVGWQVAATDSTLARLASASIIALPAPTSLSPAEQNIFTQYVTELGGSLLLVDPSSQSFAELKDLSPLAFEPPTPMHRWIVLIDASGSMSQQDGSISRFKAACDAARTILNRLPSNDQLSLGSFARDLNWWLPAATVASGRAGDWPPASQQPNGPTNLEPLLRELLTGRDIDATSTLIILTDSDAPLPAATELGRAFSAAHVPLHVLSIDASNPALAQVAHESGGEVFAANGLRGIDVAADQLANTIQPPLRKQGRIEFDHSLGLPPRENAEVATAWLREHAAAIAADRDNNPAAAEWQRGAGRVTALSFTPTSAELAVLASHIARQPSDPRVSIDVANHEIRIDASGLAECNHRAFVLQIDNGSALGFTQIGPARYSLPIDAAAQPRVATILLDGAPIRRTVISPRYAAEFDAIGNNRQNLQSIADRSGGRVIQPTDLSPISLPRVRRDYALASPFAACGALAWLLAIVRRKL